MVVHLRHGMGRSCHVDGQLESDSVYQPSVPLCLVAVAYYLALGLQRVPKVLAGIFVAAFIAYAWCERPMEYVNRTSEQRMAFTRETNLALRSRPRGKEHPFSF